MNANSKTASSTILEWTEQGRVPDGVIRAGIRRLCRQRLRDIEARDIEASARRLEDFVRMMDRGPVAPVPERANEQHYEVPPEFFQHALGAHRKYSCCYWDDAVAGLDHVADLFGAELDGALEEIHRLDRLAVGGRARGHRHLDAEPGIEAVIKARLYAILRECRRSARFQWGG